MKKMIFTLKNLLLICFMSLLGMTLQAQTTVNITVRAGDPSGNGGLQKALLAIPLTTTEIAAITDLTITTTGTWLEPADFTYINASMTSLAHLNLSGAKVSDLATGTLRETFPSNAFQNNSTLKSIVFPPSMTAIGGGAFQSCALEGIVTLPLALNGAANADFSRFGNSQNITGFAADPASTTITTVDGVLFNKTMTEIHFYPCGKVDESYTIPEGVTTIRNSAFEANYHLKTLTFASTVTAPQAGFNRYDVIGNQSTIENILVTTGSSNYASNNGMLYQLTGNRLVWSPRGKSILRITSPIETIAGGGSQNSIFGGNGNGNFGQGSVPNNYAFIPTLIDIPASVTTIENGAFVVASNLATLISRNPVPPTIGLVTFNNIGGTLTPQYSTKVYVPAANLADYKASPWAMNPATYKGFAQTAFIGFYNIGLTDATAVSSIATDIAPANDLVTVTANPASAGQIFDKWIVTGVVLPDETLASASFAMPANDVTLVATYKVDVGTGVNNVDKSTISIYPNPTTNYLQVSGVSNPNFAIYNVVGKLVSNGIAKNSTISVSDLNNGIYILKMDGKSLQFVKK